MKTPPSKSSFIKSFALIDGQFHFLFSSEMMGVLHARKTITLVTSEVVVRI